MKITKEQLVKVISEEVKDYLGEMKGQWGKMMRRDALGQAFREKPQDNSGDDAERARKEKEFQKAHRAQKTSGEGLPDWLVEEEVLQEYEQVEMDTYGPRGYARYVVDDEGNMDYVGPATGEPPTESTGGYGGYGSYNFSGGGRRRRRFEEEMDDDLGSMLDDPPSQDEMVSEEIFNMMWNPIMDLLADKGLSQREIELLEADIDGRLVDIAMEVRDALKSREGMPSIHEAEKEPMKPRGIDYYDTTSDPYDAPRTRKGKKDAKRMVSKRNRRISKQNLKKEY